MLPLDESKVFARTSDQNTCSELQKHFRYCWILQELNKARGGHVQVSRNRAHFYVYCSNVGTLWSFTNYWPFVDYEVQPFWLMGWWATGKLSNKQYKSYLPKCKKSYRGLLQNFEAVVHSENALQLEEYRETVVQILASVRLPVRSHDDPCHGSKVENFSLMRPLSVCVCQSVCLSVCLLDCLRQASRPPLMKHEDLWVVFDSLVVERPAQSVSILKVKAHVSLSTVLPDFLDKCRHYNHIADAAAKRAARDSALFSFNQLRVMNAKQDELRTVVKRFHAFLIQCARHEFAKTAGNRGSTRFDVSVLDVSTACFSHVALVDDEAFEALPVLV